MKSFSSNPRFSMNLSDVEFTHQPASSPSSSSPYSPEIYDFVLEDNDHFCIEEILKVSQEESKPVVKT